MFYSLRAWIMEESQILVCLLYRFRSSQTSEEEIMSKPTSLELTCVNRQFADCGHVVVKNPVHCNEPGCTYIFCTGDCGGPSNHCDVCDDLICPEHKCYREKSVIFCPACDEEYTALLEEQARRLNTPAPPAPTFTIPYFLAPSFVIFGAVLMVLLFVLLIAWTDGFSLLWSS
jgi:hypothetical protein